MFAYHRCHQLRILRHSDLAIDSFLLRPDGVIASKQVLGHLLIRQAPAERKRDLTLRTGQTHAVCLPSQKISCFISIQFGKDFIIASSILGE